MPPFSPHAVKSLALSSNAALLAASCGPDSATLVVTPLPRLSSLPAASASLQPAPTAVSMRLAPITALAFDANSRVYTADARGALSLYTLSADGASLARTHHVMAAHSGSQLTGVAAAPSLVATSGKDGLIKAWDPVTAACVARLKGHKGEARAVCIAETPECHLLASAGRDRSVRLWDVRVGGAGPVAIFTGKDGHDGWVHDVAMCAGPRPRILSCGGDKMVRVWDLATMRLETVCKGHQYRVWTVAAAPLGEFAVSGSTDSTVRYWPLDGCSTGAGAAKSNDDTAWEGHGDSVLAVAVARDASFAVSASENGSVLLWDIARMCGQPERAAYPVAVTVEAPIEEPRHTIRLPRSSPVVPSRAIDTDVPLSRVELSATSKGSPISSRGTRDSSPDSRDAITSSLRSRSSRMLSPRSQTRRVPSPRSPGHSAIEVVEIMSTSAVSDAGPSGEATSPEAGQRAVMPVSRKLHAPVASSPTVSAARFRLLEEQVALRDVELAERNARIRELEKSLEARDKEVLMLRQQVDSSHNLAKQANVRALCAESTDMGTSSEVNYSEPIDRISRVTGQLKALASKLDSLSLM